MFNTQRSRSRVGDALTLTTAIWGLVLGHLAVFYIISRKKAENLSTKFGALKKHYKSYRLVKKRADRIVNEREINFPKNL